MDTITRLSVGSICQGQLLYHSYEAFNLPLRVAQSLELLADEIDLQFENHVEATIAQYIEES